MAATGYTAVAVVVLVVSNVLCYVGNSTTWLHHKLPPAVHAERQQ